MIDGNISHREKNFRWIWGKDKGLVEDKNRKGSPEMYSRHCIHMYCLPSEILTRQGKNIKQRTLTAQRLLYLPWQQRRQQASQAPPMLPSTQHCLNSLKSMEVGSSLFCRNWQNWYETYCWRKYYILLPAVPAKAAVGLPNPTFASTQFTSF